MIDSIVNKLKSIATKAIIQSVDDSGEIQLAKIQGVENDLQDGVERLQPYGLTTSPPSGSESIVIAIGGSRDDCVVIIADSGEYRITGLNSGEVCFYSQYGQTILFDENGDTVFNGGTNHAVQFEALKTEFNKLKNAFDAHTHLAGLILDGTGLPCTGTTAASSSSGANIDNCKIDELKVP